MSDNTPVVVEAVRTPQGKQDGVFADVDSENLSIPLVNEILDRTQLDGSQVDDLMWGCARPVESQAANIARVIAILSNLGEEVPGTTMNRQCGSSAQAIISASDSIRAGQREVVFAGGVENMSKVDIPSMRRYDGIAARYDADDLPMGQTAERVAKKYEISRDRQDEYAARSQQRACRATDEEKFDDEILPIDTGEKVVETDEGLRPGTTKENIAGLPPAFDEDGTVTAANASQISDGSAALLLTSESFAEEHGLDILAEVGAHNVAGVDPRIMGIGPIPAVRGILERTGRDSDSYDLVELNEAFASQTLACQDELGFDDDVFNVNGGAIALGHPVGTSGARLPVTLIHELKRRGGGLGLSTLCIGYGQGIGTEFHVR
jgi:acetyl-CoA acyltransferase